MTNAVVKVLSAQTMLSCNFMISRGSFRNEQTTLDSLDQTVLTHGVPCILASGVMSTLPMFVPVIFSPRSSMEPCTIPEILGASRDKLSVALLT